MWLMRGVVSVSIWPKRCQLPVEAALDSEPHHTNDDPDARAVVAQQRAQFGARGGRSTTSVF